MTTHREPSSPTRRTRPIPEFSSYEEEAEFWDTHDVTDYFDTFVKGGLGKCVGHEIGIPISPEQMRRLSTLAEEAGTDVITLAQRWILDRLDEPGDGSPGEGHA